MLKKLKNYTQSEFVNNAGKLMTGTVISQVIPLAAAPILSRIYEPADYGVLGLYMSVTGLISMFGTLQYSNAIVIATDEEEVRGIINLCLRLLGLFAIITFLAVLILHNFIGIWLKSEPLKYWLLAAPFSIVLNGLSGIFGAYAIRTKQFTLVSRNRVASTIGSTAVSLSVGYLTNNPIGLFAGLWTNQLINGLLLSVNTLRKTGESWKAILKSAYSKVKFKYINFPKFSLPSDFINNFTNQIPVFMLNSFGSAAAVGSFNMSNRMLGLPITFISSAFGEVFRQRAAEDYNKYGNCRTVFIKTFKTLFFLSLIPFFIITLFGADIFTFFLGPKWRDAGIYTQIMGIMFLMRFIVSPLSYTIIVANKLHISLFMDIYVLVSTLILMYFGLAIMHNIMFALALFSANYSILYILTYYLSFKQTINNDKKFH